jgi:hypothetical protein
VPSEPPVEPAQQPQQQEEDYSITGKRWMMMAKATSVIRQLYGIERGDITRWGPRHDRAALAVYDRLMRGEELPEHWRAQRQAPPPIDATTWGDRREWRH